MAALATVTTAASASAATPAGKPPGYEADFDAVRAAFAEIRDTHLTAPLEEAGRAIAHERALELLAGGFHEHSGWVASEFIYQGIALSGRLHNQQSFLDAMAEEAYAYRLTDTTAAGRNSFLLAVGNLEYDRGKYVAAASLLDSFLAKGVTPGIEAATASAYNIRGFAYRYAQDYTAAARVFEAAAEMYATLPGHESSAMVSLGYAARAHSDGGDLARALELATSAMAVYESLGEAAADNPQAYDVLTTYALMLQRTGDYAGALAKSEEAIAMVRRSGDARRIAVAYSHAAFLAEDQGDFESAERYLWQSIKSVPGGTAPRIRQEMFDVLADVLYARGKLESAFQVKGWSLTISDSLQREAQTLNVRRLAENAEAHRVRLELARTKAEASELAVAQARRRLALTWGGIALVALVGAFAYVSHRLRRKHVEHDRLEVLVAERTAVIARQKTDAERHARQLERSNMELERFAYIASHDLKTPIRNVTSFLGLIERRLPAEARAGVQEYLDLAGGYARQMHALVTDVLEFSRIDADLAEKSTRIDLRDMAEGLRRERARGLAETSATVEITGRAAVYAPEAYVRQLLTNLVDNGLKYNRSPFPRVRISMSGTPGEPVCVRVADNGIGIAEEYRGRVFEMFKRLHTSDEFEGTGLGLSVCKKVIERLGGTIAVESVEGEGSTFEVVFPPSASVEEATASGVQQAS